MSTITAGLVAAEYFRRFPGRFYSMHLQDVDMNTPARQGEGHPQVAMGKGSIDWREDFRRGQGGRGQELLRRAKLGTHPTKRCVSEDPERLTSGSKPGSSRESRARHPPESLVAGQSGYFVARPERRLSVGFRPRMSTRGQEKGPLTVGYAQSRSRGAHPCQPNGNVASPSISPKFFLCQVNHVRPLR